MSIKYIFIGETLNSKNAILALADGSVFYGTAIGTLGYSTGEVVFNTSMTGYQEILTDPSYAQQIITLTYPHIGNVGTNTLDWESDTIYSSGLVIRDASIVMSSWRGEKTLKDYLVENKVIAISDIDTRQLTRILRDKGTQNGCILALEDPQYLNVEKAISMAQSFKGLKNLDLAKEVTVKTSYEWTRGGEWQFSGNACSQSNEEKYHIVAYDFGIKKNILRKLVERGCKITVVPAQTSSETVMAINPDGVFLSNGPGDPVACQYAIESAKAIIDKKIPTFGICLGMQIISLALGANAVKMKFGHHGANHPVEDIKSKRVFITSQNHGFAIEESSLPDNLTVTHRSLFDGSLQGIEKNDSPVFAFQGHPEASPGPQDMDALFDHFIDLMKGYQNRK